MGTPAAVLLPKSNVSQGPLNAAERQELVELRRKLQQYQMETDILLKACAPSLPARESKPGRTARAGSM